MKYSTNYNMNKPELSEQYRLDHWNNNTDIIDTELKRNADNITNAETALQNITNPTFRTALLNFCYPIGSLYWSSKDTDPSTLFGGTWVQIKDRFIWAKGDEDTVDDTGGSKTVQLTESNLPAHTHSFSGTTGNVSGTGSEWTHSHSMTLPIYGGDLFNSNINDARFCGDNYRSGTKTVTGYTNSPNLQHTHSFSGTTGNGNGTASAIGIMPPYIVKYCWERTA